MESRWTHALFAAALALLGWLYVHFEPLHWAHYTDPLIYLNGAESIAAGDGYRFASYVNTPKISCHPPLQSAYLALFWRFDSEFPKNLPVLYGAMIGLSLGCLTLFYLVSVRYGLPPWLSLLLVLTWGLTSAWGTLIYAFFSDILFTALWLLLAFYWLGKPDQQKAATWLAAGVLLSLLYLARSASAPLLGVVGLVLLQRGRQGRGWRPFLFCFAPVVVTVTAWKIYRTGAPGYADFMYYTVMKAGGLAAMLPVFWDNAIFYLSGLGFMHALVPGFMNLPSSHALLGGALSSMLILVGMLGGWALMACWVYGCWRKGSALDRIGGWMVLAYLIQLTIYPTKLGERALFPALPFVLIWAWNGRELLFRWVRRERILAAATALFMFATAIANGAAFTQDMGYLEHSDFADDLAEIGAWLRTNTPPETVVAASLSEPVVHLHHLSGRRVIENYFQPQPWFSVASQSIPKAPEADYLLLSWYSWMKIDEANFNRFHLVAQSSRSHYRLYRAGGDDTHLSSP